VLLLPACCAAPRCAHVLLALTRPRRVARARCATCSGPTLPTRLLSELGGQEGGGGGSGSGSGAGGGGAGRSGAAPRPAGTSFAVARKARRKQERQEKGQRVRAPRPARCSVRRTLRQPPPSRAAHPAPACVLRQRARYSAPRSAGDEDDEGGEQHAPSRGGAAPARPAAAAAAAAPAKRSRDAPSAAPPAKRAAPAAPPAKGKAGSGGAASAKPAAARPTLLPPHQQKLRDDIEAELRLQRQLSKKLKGRTARAARALRPRHARRGAARLTRAGARTLRGALRRVRAAAAQSQRTLEGSADALAPSPPFPHVFGARRRGRTTG
jgi:hypothetical protein